MRALRTDSVSARHTVHGLTISFFTLGRRVHSRVTSITRTFTVASRDTQGNYEEPAWMSRVKRARAGEEIVINRDDDGQPEISEKFNEKGEKIEPGSRAAQEDSARGDVGTLAMFGAPPSKPIEVEPTSTSGSGTGSGSGSGSHTGSDTLESDDVEKQASKRDDEEADADRLADHDREEEHAGLPLHARRPSYMNRRTRTQEAMKRENDDDPPYNVLAEHDNEIERHPHGHAHAHQPEASHEEGAEEKAHEAGRGRSASNATRESAKDANYCPHDQVQTWAEGRKVSRWVMRATSLTGPLTRSSSFRTDHH